MKLEPNHRYSNREIIQAINESNDDLHNEISRVKQKMDQNMSSTSIRLDKLAGHYEDLKDWKIAQDAISKYVSNKTGHSINKELMKAISLLIVVIGVLVVVIQTVNK